MKNVLWKYMLYCLNNENYCLHNTNKQPLIHSESPESSLNASLLQFFVTTSTKPVSQ